MSVKKLATASFANLLIPISGLLISPILSRELGPDGRGLYAALTLPLVVSGWIGTLGLQDSLSYHLSQRKALPRQALRVALVASLPLGLLCVGALVLLGRWLFTGAGPSYGQFVLLSLLAPVHVLFNLLIGTLTGVSDVRGVNVVKALPALLRAAVVALACLLLDVSAFVAAFIFVASALAGVVVGVWRIRAVESADRDPDPTADPAGLNRSFVAYSWACLPGVLAAVSTARLDQVIGLPLLGARQLGYYAVAVSVAEIPMVIATAARTLLLGSRTNEDRSVARTTRFAVAASFCTCLVLALSASFAVPLFFGGAFRPAVLPTVILTGGTVLYTGMICLTAILLTEGRAKASSRALVVGSVVGVGLLLVLYPLGAVGAAVASLAGYGLSFLLAWRALAKLDGRHSLGSLVVLNADDLVIIARRLRGLVRGRRAAEAIEEGSRL